MQQLKQRIGAAWRTVKWFLDPHKGPAVELNSTALQAAYEEGLENQDGLLDNPYLEGTKLYIAWEMGSRKRRRRDMTVW
ncbi:hypothetical protein [Paraburkholderia sp. BL23I1N1]|uniref:hypothetical protein n=1 Tax=Paraburkholderia sp. BL23I1N1 TaxID=1938802 RepID=UPI000E76435F|nr:hypothetical protein [Paraburkholderia sp. BL23I1N1]